ncbi:helix-turn-helix domain-containing protein [Streptomyces sp. NPDC050315]|uniref:helix-turn-helix domain-containing protein n=1 Tax=Streptomyces sp. NPDC050315 TaxID=3155039 RepID=UPI00343725B0
MSETPNTNVRALHAVPDPDPQPLAGLTGAPAAIYTELFSLTEKATVAELALAAGLGRSTTGKALATLEDHGLAVREPGGHRATGRVPDRWSLAQPDTPAGPEADGVIDSLAGDTTPDDSPALVEQPNTSAECSVPNEDTSEATTSENPPGDQHGPDEAGGSASTPAPEVADLTAPARSSHKRRLEPGALRQMVLAHLEAHPGVAFTATRISRVIEKSSGAIANALQKLVHQQLVEQVTDRPRTFRLVTTDDGAQKAQ